MTTAEGTLPMNPTVPTQASQTAFVEVQHPQPIRLPKKEIPIPRMRMFIWIISALSCFVLTNITYRVLSEFSSTALSIIGPRDYVNYNGVIYSPITFITKKTEVNDNISVVISRKDFVTEIPDIIENLKIDMFLIDNNPISTLPDSLGNISTLQMLGISNTHLRSLPTSIGNNTNLIDLSLQGNRITQIPESVGSLRNLEVLVLSYNNLSSLPRSMKSLVNVKILDLTGNKFRQFPTNLPPNLELLYIGGNHISAKNLETAQRNNALSDLTIYY